uniref:Uncharacterized protein n=1 Tax=Angiostrongylus cantonensis TaxID=6313 RepID=A0A0K0CW92_ANGCA
MDDVLRGERAGSAQTAQRAQSSDGYIITISGTRAAASRPRPRRGRAAATNRLPPPRPVRRRRAATRTSPPGCVRLSVCISVCPSLRPLEHIRRSGPSICPYVAPYVCSYVGAYVRQSVCTPVLPSLFVRMSARSSVRSSVCLSVRPSVQTFVLKYVLPFVHPSFYPHKNTNNTQSYTHIKKTRCAVGDKCEDPRSDRCEEYSCYH